MKRVPNPCAGATIERVEVPTPHYAIELPWTPSTPALTAYAKAQKHRIPKVRGKKKSTTGNDAFGKDNLPKILDKYGEDPIYSKLEDWRAYQKALGTYLAKFGPGSPLLGADGRLHDIFRHTPKTLRLAMELLQVLPKPKDTPSGWAYTAIRRCLVPSVGHSYLARDFSNIEPKLAAYFMRSASFLRATNTSAHSWFAANVINKPVDFGWSDADITTYYEELAAGGPYLVSGELRPWKTIRNACKTAGMAALYAGTASAVVRGNRAVFPTQSIAQYYLDAFYRLVPELGAWHWATAEEAETHGYLTSPIGMRLYAYGMFSYSRDEHGQWSRELTEEAKKAIAAKPQHMGAVYLYEAVRRLRREAPWMRPYLRLLIHDEIFLECPTELVDTADAALRAAMEVPHPKMPLWPEAQKLLGQECLMVSTEAKRSPVSWGDMKG